MTAKQVTVEMTDDALVLDTPHGVIEFSGESLAQLRNIINEKAPAPPYVVEMHRQLKAITDLLEGICKQQMLITQRLNRGLH